MSAKAGCVPFGQSAHGARNTGQKDSIWLHFQAFMMQLDLHLKVHPGTVQGCSWQGWGQGSP